MDPEVNAYFQALADDRKRSLLQIHELIMGHYPSADISMKYKMPTYESGEGSVAIANQKQYISVYTCGAHHLVQFKQKHPKIKTGKGCINLKPTDPVPLKDLQQVIRHAIEKPKG